MRFTWFSWFMILISFFISFWEEREVFSVEKMTVRRNLYYTVFILFFTFLVLMILVVSFRFVVFFLYLWIWLKRFLSKKRRWCSVRFFFNRVVLVLLRGSCSCFGYFFFWVWRSKFISVFFIVNKFLE